MEPPPSVQPMAVQLTSPDGRRSEVSVPVEGVVVGRAGGDADVGLEGDTGMSRRHGRLWLEGGAVWYEDLGSANGSWRDGQRLSERARLEPGVRIALAKTILTLATDGMSLQLQAPVEQRADLLADRPRRFTAALYEFVQALLGSTSPELMARAIRVIEDVVPAAQRISIVSWPPDAENRARPLVPPQEGDAGPISISLARWAVDSGQALLLSDAQREAETEDVEASVLRHGIRSAVYVPLLTADRVPIGVLCVDTPRPGLPFNENDFQFVRALGSLLATALASERLREDARRAEVEAREVQARREAMMAFLKIASHDLRSPLTVMMLSARAAQKRPDLGATLMETIIDACRRAQNLIHTYLEVAALDEGKALAVEREDIGLAALIDEEITFVRQAFGERAARIQFSALLDVTSVSADPLKLRQMLGNLLSNAVKYSPDGGRVRVAVLRTGEETVFHVTDQGVGITKEDQERLFGQFQRVGDSVARGIGLGLWLTAALARAHGGRIWVESEPGRGSTFSFSIASASESCEPGSTSLA